MSKVGYVCSLMVVVAALACGGDDDGGASGAGGGGGGTLCDQQLARAEGECMIPAGFLTTLQSGATNDAGVSACMGRNLCTAQCAQAATCAELTTIPSPFFTCFQACPADTTP